MQVEQTAKCLGLLNLLIFRMLVSFMGAFGALGGSGLMTLYMGPSQDSRTKMVATIGYWMFVVAAIYIISRLSGSLRLARRVQKMLKDRARKEDASDTAL